jgi:hypothetical protein
LSLIPSTGLLEGTYTPAGGKPETIRGVYLPKQQYGYGLFLTPTGSEALELSP